jgi:hypothetical protein
MKTIKEFSSLFLVDFQLPMQTNSLRQSSKQTDLKMDRSICNKKTNLPTSKMYCEEWCFYKQNKK